MKKITFLMVALVISAAAMAQMSGVYKVGTAGISNDFPSLSTAVTALNANVFSADVILEITSDITEAANIGLGVNTNGFGITIRPDADVDRTITFTKMSDNSSPSGHFVIGYPSPALLSGWTDASVIATSKVTIDGYAVGGNTRRLKFTNSLASFTNARIITVVGACENTTIKNCIIENLTTHTGSPSSIAAIVRANTSPAAELAPNGLVIENNILKCNSNAVAMGMRITSSGSVSGTASAFNRVTGFIFRNNVVSAQRRLLEINYTNGAEIYNNEFSTIQTGVPGTVSYGLWTSTAVIGTINIFNNKFLKSETEETGAYGHRVVSLSSGASYNIYNNTFAGMDKTKASSAALNLYYLFYSGIAGKIYNNTFYMPALTNATHTGGAYRAIHLSGNTAAIKNNIFINDEAMHTAITFISAVPTPASDHNVYFFRQQNVNAKIVGTYATLGEYQTANPTKDINSKNVNVNFLSATDLSLTGVSVQDGNLAVPRLSDVLTDMFGTLRAETTYAGAHESTLPFISTAVDPVGQEARIIRTSSGIEIKLDGEAMIELYSINGMLIEKTNVSGTYSRDLDKGVYIIRINGKATKFIK